MSRSPQPSRALLASTVLAAGGCGFAATEALFLRALLAAPPDVAGNYLFQELWTGLLPGGIGLALLTNGGAALAGAWAWWHHSARTAAVTNRAVVGFGAMAAAAHFAWVPAVAALIERIVNHPVDSRRDVHHWLRLHYVRTAISNITALGCFVAAWYVM